MTRGLIFAALGAVGGALAFQFGVPEWVLVACGATTAFGLGLAIEERKS